jgi:ABC-type multidrug transport system ATPase subunit
MGSEVNRQADEKNITLTGVARGFGGRAVLKCVDFSARPGEVVCLCGLNGAGKSTMLRIVCGLLQPDAGAVRLCGLDPSASPEAAAGAIGLISHKSMVYPDLTVMENMVFFAELYGLRNPRARAQELLEAFELSNFRREMTAVLSRGMLQRLSIARALVNRPAVLLADEPFTGLDLRASGGLVLELGRFSAGGGTVLMTTHELGPAVECCGRVAVLDGGRIIFDSPIEDVDIEAFRRDYLSYARGAS